MAVGGGEKWDDEPHLEAESPGPAGQTPRSPACWGMAGRFAGPVVSGSLSGAPAQGHLGHRWGLEAHPCPGPQKLAFQGEGVKWREGSRDTWVAQELGPVGGWRVSRGPPGLRVTGWPLWWLEGRCFRFTRTWLPPV